MYATSAATARPRIAATSHGSLLDDDALSIDAPITGRGPVADLAGSRTSWMSGRGVRDTAGSLFGRPRSVARRPYFGTGVGSARRGASVITAGSCLPCGFV